MMRKLFLTLYGAMFLACAVVMGAVGYATYALPDTYTVTKGEMMDIGEHLAARAAAVSVGASDQTAALNGQMTVGEYRAPLNLFGFIPVKEVTVSVVDAPVVTVCGTPFGIKLYTDGVLIVRMSDVQTAAGGVNPAAAAGIRVGDTILSINGTEVTTNEEVAACINACGGRAVTLRIRRDGVEFDAAFTPARPVDGEGYRAGLWVRDSTAGIGMLTFYDENGAFAGLGHPVCDTDTGQMLSVSTGEIVPACIRDVEKSVKGTPGELHGYFEKGTLGRLSVNAADGVYGTLANTPNDGVRMPMAMKQEIKEGTAQILTTVEGTEPTLYDIMIRQVRYNTANNTRSMVIEVTDEELLSQTGGIVQGMSGSPIIQNGKLIGAVTHVLVDDPTKGYAIFAENMLVTAQSITNNVGQGLAPAENPKTAS